MQAKPQNRFKSDIQRMKDRYDWKDALICFGLFIATLLLCATIIYAGAEFTKAYPKDGVSVTVNK